MPWFKQLKPKYKTPSKHTVRKNLNMDAMMATLHNKFAGIPEHRKNEWQDALSCPAMPCSPSRTRLCWPLTTVARMMKTISGGFSTRIPIGSQLPQNLPPAECCSTSVCNRGEMMIIRTTFSRKSIYCAILALLSHLIAIPSTVVASGTISSATPLSHIIIPGETTLKGNGNFIGPAVSISGTLPESRLKLQHPPSFAQHFPGDHTPKFVPGRFIVKFADSLAEPADLIYDGQRSFATATPVKGDELDRLHNKHGIKSVKPLFSRLLGPHPSGLAKKESSAERKRRFTDHLSLIKAKYQKRTLRASRGGEIPDLSNVYVFESADGADIPAICREYAANPNVVYAVPVQVASVQATSNDPYFFSSGSWGNTFDDLWGLKKIDAQTAWNSSRGQGVVVAVVDTGLDYNHIDINGNVWANNAETNGSAGVDDDHNGFVDDVRGWNFVSNNNDPRDGNGHGTHVAGTIAAVGNNGVGVVGVAYESRIMPVKGLGDDGSGGFDQLANAIVYAATNGADVISNSWGCWGCAPDPLIEDAVRTANSLGSVVVFAAGNNSGDATYDYPANIQDVVTVGSTGVDDSLSSFSNWGHMIDVVAPGGGGADDLSISNSTYNILSLRASGTGNPSYVIGDAYVRLAGTSMATPHVSGVAALLLAANPNLTRNQVISIIRHSADDLIGPSDMDTPGFDLLYGWGRLNAARAVSMASSPPPDPPIMRIPASQLDFDLPYSQCGGERFEKLDIFNIGGDVLNWTSATPSWLSVAPASGTAHAVPAVTVNTSTSQQGLVNFTCPEAVDGRKDIPVTATVHPEVRIDQCSLVLTQAEGKQEWAPLWNANVPGIPDGQGGVFYVWGDVYTNPNVTVQHIDPQGRPLWGNGKPLTTLAPPGAAFRPAIASDGAGGAIIVWVEGENNNLSTLEQTAKQHIRGQRVSADGAFLWGAEGIWVNQAAGGQLDPRITADGAGGAIVTWKDYRSGNVDVYAQRVSATGQIIWQGDGVPAASVNSAKDYPSLAADGTGGAIIAWMDGRRNYTDIYAQHISSAGIPLWGDGVLLNNQKISAVGPSVVADAAGGAIIAWYDFRNFPLNPSGATVLNRADIYATRLNGAGQNLWGAGEIPLLSGLTANPKKWYPDLGPFEVNMVADGTGGAIAVWHDSRNADWLDPSWDIYAQRVDGNGQVLWTASGVPVSDARGSQITPSVVADGAGGAFFSYIDGRSGDWDVFIQRLDAVGNRQWGPGGLWIQRDIRDQLYPYLVQLGGNRLALSWDDWRNYDGSFMTGTLVDIFGKIIQLCADRDGNGYYDEGGICGPVNPSDNELAVTLAGTGKGTVTSSPGSIVCGGDCSGYFSQGTAVVLTATPDPSALFTGWSGACTGTGNCTVTMDGDQRVTATFTRRPTIDYYRLGNGGGTVTFSPGSSCSESCSPYYAERAQIFLTAVPAADSYFAGWLGACRGTGSCSLVMGSDKQVAALFLSTGDTVTSVTAGYDHSIALTGDGKIWSWGSNLSGQLGNGNYSNIPQTFPLQSPVLQGVTAIATGSSADHTLALRGDGSVWSWGRGGNNQLGYPPTVSSTPLQAPGLPPMAGIAAGNNHSLALTGGGIVWAWGENSSGQLGDGTTTSRTNPQQVPNLTEVVAIAGGGGHTLAVKGDGTVWAWGNNWSGQLGDGNTTQRNSPVQVAGLTGVVAVAAGSYHTVALKGDGTVWAWGNNWFGQLGDGSMTQRNSPVQVAGLTGVVAVAAGSYHTVALKGDGTVWTWGENGRGQIGDGTNIHRQLPFKTLGVSEAFAIAAGAKTTFAVLGNGALLAWGSNSSGQLGDGTTVDRLTPVQTIYFDTIPPDTIITGQPANPMTSSAAIFTFTSPDPTASFECLLDSGSWTTCSSGIIYNGLTSGSHTFSVRAKDPTGNVDPTPATYSWNVNWPTSCNVKINLAGCYVTISEAYNVSNSGDIIQAQGIAFSETIDANRSIDVSIQGGYADNFASRTTSASSIDGMTITSGTLIADSLTVK